MYVRPQCHESIERKRENGNQNQSTRHQTATFFNGASSARIAPSSSYSAFRFIPANDEGDPGTKVAAELDSLLIFFSGEERGEAILPLVSGVTERLRELLSSAIRRVTRVVAEAAASEWHVA